jgi:endonuclease-3
MAFTQQQLIERLKKHFPNPKIELNYENEFQLLIEEIIKPLGFYKRKAKLIKECVKAIVEKFSGQIPKTLEELISLPGVGRKTASAFLVNAYKIPAIVVDTHVKRVVKRLKITNQTNPEKVEKDLAKFFSYVSDICPYEKRTCEVKRWKYQFQ